MKFEPTAAEELLSITHIDKNGPCSLESKELAVAGSDWSHLHLRALRVILLDRLPVSRLFPSEYLPSKDHPLYSDLAPKILEPTEDDLKSYALRREELAKNPFSYAFNRIAKAIATRPAHVPGTVAHERNPSPESDLSTSSNEDKHEESSKQIASALLDCITTLGDPSITYKEQVYSIEMDVDNQAMTIPLGTKPSKVVAYNDGGLCLTRQGKYTESNRYGTVPLLSIEAKRRHAANIRRPAGEEEKYIPNVLAQEVAELLGQAMEHNAQLGGRDSWRDQEAFILSIHGTHLKLTAAHFTGEYLRYVNSPIMPETQTLWVRRSQPHDLKTRQGRASALQLCIGVIDYLQSGEAEIGLLQKIFEG